ncbi:MAG TPA: hypothetical protein PKM73_01985 [Verrucomicrobiota bacterium]|nr:hypothetical protein [Verrucomicrobiota bacterium]HNU50321.1 hypothetical protein [Verrucomicrobiota bacterium]
MTRNHRPKAECLERHAQTLRRVDRQVHHALAAVGLHMTGSPFHWSEDPRKPDLISALVGVFVAGLIPLLVGPTAGAKSLLLEAMLRLLVGPRLSVIWCSAYLDPSIFERIVATRSGPAIADRDFGVALALEEITKNLGGAPVTTVKRLLSHNFAFVGMTGNWLGARYHTEPPDESLVSRTAAFAVHEATTVADRHARLDQRLLSPGDVSGLGPLLDVEGRPAFHALLEAREDLAMVPIEDEALEFLLVADSAACVHRGGGSAAHQGERCSSCSCHAASACGTLPPVPNLGMRLSALARATALRLAAPGQPPIVDAELLRLWLPALTTPEQRIAPVKDRSHAADRALAWWDGLVEATGSFKSRFGDLLEQLEDRPDRALTTPQRLAVEAFSASVNPNPVALLDLARIRGRRQRDLHREESVVTPDTALSLAGKE